MQNPEVQKSIAPWVLMLIASLTYAFVLWRLPAYDQFNEFHPITQVAYNVLFWVAGVMVMLAGLARSLSKIIEIRNIQIEINMKNLNWKPLFAGVMTAIGAVPQAISSLHLADVPAWLRISGLACSFVTFIYQSSRQKDKDVTNVGKAARTRKELGL